MATVSSIGGSALLDDVVDSYAYLPLESYHLYFGVDYFYRDLCGSFLFFSPWYILLCLSDDEDLFLI